MIAEAVGHSVEEIKRWKNDMKLSSNDIVKN